MLLDFFLFGTLSDPELRKIVIGRDVCPHHEQKGTLLGYRPVRLQCCVQPGLIKSAQGTAEGLLVKNLSPDEAARLSHYEGERYGVKRLEIMLHDFRNPAWVFQSNPKLEVKSGNWSLEHWQSRYKKRSLIIAEKWMCRISKEVIDDYSRKWASVIEAH